jgi:hypothetical protein
VLRLKPVVDPAEQNNISRTAVAAEAEGVAMVTLESRAGRAASALFVLVTASPAIPFIDHALDRRRDVA